MTYTLDELTTPLTRAEVEAKIYAALAARGVTVTAWKAGSVVRTMIAASSIVMAAFSELTARAARAGFAELAEGAWLDLVATHGRGIARIEATYAAGSLTLTNAGGGIYSLDPDDLIVASAETGKQYRNTDAFTLGALETVTIGIRAVEAGAASTAAPGEITSLVTPLLGVSATNAAPVVGTDAETDAELRTRYAERLGSLSPLGPWDAYTYAARMATRADGSRVGVMRVRTVPDGAGRVTVYVATSSGGVPGTATNPSTDLGAIAEAVAQGAEPLAITAEVVSAAPVTVPVTYKLWILNTSGLSPAQIREAVEDALIAFFREQPIGGHRVGVTGKIYHDAIRTVIGSALPQIFHVELTSPASDVSLSSGDVAVLGTVTAASILQISPSEAGAGGGVGTVGGGSGGGGETTVTAGTLQPTAYGPLGQWALGDASGVSLADRSGNARHLTDGAVPFSPTPDLRPGYYAAREGAAYRLDAALCIAGPLTIIARCWVRQSNVAMTIAQCGAIGEGEDANVLFEFGVGTSRHLTYFAEHDAGVNTSATASGDELQLEVGKWHFVALRRDADGTVTFTLDGSSNVYPTPLAVPTGGSTGRFTIGQDYAANSAAPYFDGGLADVSVWDVRLTDEQLAAQRAAMGM